MKENFGLLNAKENNNSYESRIMTLNERLDITANADDQKFKLIKDKLSKLQEGIASEKLKLEQADDAQYKTLEFLENNCLTQYTMVSEEKKSKETQLDTSINDKFFEYKVALQRETKEREDNFLNISQSVNEQLSDIKTALNAQESKREQKSDDLLKYINSECGELNEMIQIEKQSRIEHHQAMYKMLGDIFDGLTIEIMAEKRQREVTEESILKLLEETIKRVEVSISD
eukprot:Mrub_09307.p1 GENE.Mrub_09307~~Mrub_09307.p1  ORF type:complete len:248 (-),score=51.61 Mrub_09307:18-707(-)